MDFGLSSFNSFHLSLSLMAGPLISFLSSFLAVSCELHAFIIKEMDSSFKCSVFPGCHWFPWIKVTVIPIQWYDFFFIYMRRQSVRPYPGTSSVRLVSNDYDFQHAGISDIVGSLFIIVLLTYLVILRPVSFTLYWESIIANFNGYYTCTSSFVAYFDH